MHTTGGIHIKLADFGISKCAGGIQLDTLIGTRDYAVPELQGFGELPNGQYDLSIDIWSLGCVIQEVLTGEVPFLETSGKNLSSTLSGFNVQESDRQVDMGLLLQFCGGNRAVLTDKLQHISSEARDFLGKLLVVYPGDRMSAAGALGHRWLR